MNKIVFYFRKNTADYPFLRIKTNALLVKRLTYYTNN